MTEPTECGREVLETIPRILIAIREEMRSRRPKTSLSVPQFRALACLHYLPNASLSDVAAHVGTALPPMSKMVDGLVTRGYVSRRESPEDRRRVVLALTEDGKSVLVKARRTAESRMAEMLAGLSEEECANIIRAMKTLRTVFVPGRATRPKENEA